MPLLLQGITYLIPAKYLIVIVKGIALKGVGAAMLWTQIIFLLFFTILVLVICANKLKLQLGDN
jgi:ABC-2 type transport system permease protein